MIQQLNFMVTHHAFLQFMLDYEGIFEKQKFAILLFNFQTSSTLF